jgi:hypothetical protein
MSKMNNKTLTVAELIQILQQFDQDLPVEMGMNLEYQTEVTEDMIIEEYDGRHYLMITDCPHGGVEYIIDDGE